MITPMDIENKEFKKGFRGYNEEEVDEFLDSVKEDFENLYRENLDLKEKLKLYQEQVSRYKSIEETLNATLITAQTAAEDTCNAANKKARIIELQNQYDNLVKEFKVFRNKFKSLIKDEMTTLDEIFYDVDEQCKEPFVSSELSADMNTLLAEDEAASALE